RDVRREHDASADVVEGPRRAHAHRIDDVPALQEAASRAGHGCDHVRETRLRRVHAQPVDYGTLFDDGGQDLRAAKVDPQRAQLALTFGPRATSVASDAMTLSSSVATTNTATALVPELTTGPPARLASGSNSNPRKLKPSTASARMRWSFSPTPAVKTTASIPPIAAA